LERLGYFSVDLDSSADKLVLNRTVSLKDSWGKEVKKSAK
jgi:glutaminyl-tRNA synthetase